MLEVKYARLLTSEAIFLEMPALQKLKFSLFLRGKPLASEFTTKKDVFRSIEALTVVTGEASMLE